MTLVAAPLSAQMAIGSLVDSASHRPIGNAVVELLNTKGDKVIAGTSSDSSGVFYLSAPRPGQYKLRIAQRGMWFDESPPFDLAADQTVQRRFSLHDRSRESVPTETTVDEQPVPKRGNPAPKYPPDLRIQGTQGAVLLALIIDSRGEVVPRSAQILYETQPEFGRAVLDVIYAWHFVPALKNGAPSPERVCMPTTFRLTNFGGTPDADARMDSLERAWPKTLQCPPG